MIRLSALLAVLALMAVPARAQTDIPRLRSLLYPTSCLDAAPGVVGNGLSLAPCNGSATQHWLYYPGDPGSMMLDNGANDGFYHFLTDTPLRLDVYWPSGNPQRWNWTGQYLRYGASGHCIYAKSATIIAEGTCAGSGTKWTTTAGSAQTGGIGMHQLSGEAGFTNWEQTLNLPIGSMIDHGDSVPFTGCWDSYDSGINTSWHPNLARNFTYHVGFFPDWYNCPGQWPTISQAAADAGGAYSAHWAGVANNLVGNGYATAAHPVYIIPGWEFDGGWYAWGIGNQWGNDTPDDATYCRDYVLIYQKLVAAFRSVSPNFLFVFNPTSNAQQRGFPTAYTDCFAGLQNYADFVGLDFYDDPWSSTADDTQRFHEQADGAFAAIASLSSQYGKPIVFPEWAQGEATTAVGGSWPHDDPTFINLTAAFIADVTMAGAYPRAMMGWHAYWSGDAASGYCGYIDVDANNCYGPGGYPNARAAYIARFKH